jgi:DNA replication and repair protein RecF
MRLLHLQLADYRNIHRLDIDLPAGVAIFVGDNAEGKSNLLEAIYLLATMRGLRAETDVQLVRQGALEDVLPAARLVAQAETLGGPLKLEVTIVARPGASGPIATKTVRVNGVPKRLSDAVGRVTAVLFTADDLDMIGGSPALRRRYIDITLMQVDQQYGAARSRFERVLVQRNHLLKRVREGLARPDELAFWDGELGKDGGLIVQRRAAALSRLAVLAQQSHTELAAGELVEVAYRPRLEALTMDLQTATVPEAVAAYQAALARSLSRDIAAGMTLQGPHRDDILFSLNGLPAAGFASRAQQRTVALSLRLAEAHFLCEHRGEPPVLLLDDVLSEMDAGRRQAVLGALREMDQMLVTGTDLNDFSPGFVSRAAVFAVRGGSVRQVVPGLATPQTADS